MSSQNFVARWLVGYSLGQRVGLSDESMLKMLQWRLMNTLRMYRRASIPLNYDSVSDYSFFSAFGLLMFFVILKLSQTNLFNIFFSFSLKSSLIYAFRQQSFLSITFCLFLELNLILLCAETIFSKLSKAFINTIYPPPYHFSSRHSR